MKKVLLSLLIIFFISNPARAEEEKNNNFEIIPLLNLEVLGGYSGLIDQAGDGSGLASLDFSPTLKFDENNYLIPLISSSFERKRQVISEEEGGQLSSMKQDHSIHLSFKHLFDQKFSTRITSFGTWSFNNETKDENWGGGLYDYEDIGGNINFQYKTDRDNPFPGVLSSTTEYYQRRYPNFSSLISLIVVNPPEEHIKDYQGARQVVGYGFKPLDKFFCNLEYSFLYKRYIDKLVVDQNGILTDDKRIDYVHTFETSLFFTPQKRWQFNLGLLTTWNLSNQNFNNEQNTPAPGDDVFTRHYFDYISFEVKPAITYFYPLSEEKNLSLELAYQFLLRDYSDRQAQDSAGNYKNEDQTDYEHSIILRTTYPLTKNLSLVGQGEYNICNSNMEFENFYLYSYRSYAAWAGLAFKY
ncbi:MAG: hypothetical protein U9R31_02190 [Candidatus Omnitrophota bacterium]|nr:hypothetical protein [Candidatus Omnitrophota bacterium]